MSLSKYSNINILKTKLKSLNLDRPEEQVATISCSMRNVINRNAVITKFPKSKSNTLLKTAYDGTDACNIYHFDLYLNTNKNQIVSINEIFSYLVSYISDLKLLVSAFNNYLWEYLYMIKQPLEELKTSFFTDVINACLGDTKSKYYDIFNQFAISIKLSHFLPRLENISQIIEYVKGELKVICSNNIQMNFENRVLSMIKWRILDIIPTVKYDKNVKSDIFKVKSYIYKCLTTQQPINIEDLKLKFVKLDNNTLNDTFKEDINLFNTIHSYISGLNKDGVKEKRHTFEGVLKSTPHLFISYMLYGCKLIDTLDLTRVFNECKESMNNIINIKDRGNKWTEIWNFPKCVVPTFKIMPLYKVKSHFITFDKKQFNLLGIKTITKRNHTISNINVLNKTSNVVYEGDEYRKVNTVEYKTFGFTFNPDYDLYINGYNTIELQNDTTSGWWLSIGLDVYSKKANIRELIREQNIRSQSKFNEFVETLDTTSNNIHMPWIPGATFMTDGLQLKLLITTLRSNRMVGLKGINKSKYTGIKTAKSVKSVNMSDDNVGLYYMNEKLELEENDIKNYIYVGIDPGKNKPLSSCCIDGSKFNKDWSDTSRYDTLNESLDDNKYITYSQYRYKVGTKRQETLEKKRRKQNIKYKDAISSFQGTISKSSSFEVTKPYYQTLFNTWNVIKTEVTSHSRTLLKFLLFSKARSAVTTCTNIILEKAIEKSKELKKKLIIFFGDGSFCSSGHGKSSIPKKSFLKCMGSRYKVIVTNEFRTSKLHPMSFNELKTEEGTRDRQCKTENAHCYPNSSVKISQEQVKIHNKIRDRDAFGSVGICQKGFYELIKNPIKYYKYEKQP